ncbi:MAG: hypothetical protein GX606_04895 [Elusimicrobia bacterium]|nr:hypothetical protein [Elusimicrobiota bacterium]
MECQREKNREDCGCTYAGCSRQGMCCACVRYHRSKGAIPGCFFPREAEKTYDRSIEAFIRSYGR